MKDEEENGCLDRVPGNTRPASVGSWRSGEEEIGITIHRKRRHDPSPKGSKGTWQGKGKEARAKKVAPNFEALARQMMLMSVAVSRTSAEYCLY